MSPLLLIIECLSFSVPRAICLSSHVESIVVRLFSSTHDKLLIVDLDLDVRRLVVDVFFPFSLFSFSRLRLPASLSLSFSFHIHPP